MGDWKLLRHPNQKPNLNQVNAQPRDTRIQLFNLAVDPGETTNLADKHPDRVRHMLAKLQTIQGAGRSR